MNANHITLLCILLPVAGLSLAWQPHARADDASANKALATDLFDRGVRTMRAGGCESSPVADRAVCEEARDAFRRSFELYPAGLGALRNLANVEANLGLVASAARAFRELARRAPHDPDPARRMWAEFARQSSEKLAARVPHLQIDIASDRPETLTLDGADLPAAAWQTPIELDPGPHTVRAEAPGHAPFEASFELAEAEQKMLAIELPTLLAEARDAPEPAAPSAPPARRRGARLGPLLLMGAGGAALGVGLGIGYVALRKRDDACGASNFCEPDGLASGRRVAHASTIVTSAGAAAVAAGLVWYFVAKRTASERATAALPVAGPNGVGLALSRRF